MNLRTSACFVSSITATCTNIHRSWSVSRSGSDWRSNYANRDNRNVARMAAQQAGFFDREVIPVSIAQKKGDPPIVSTDEHPRDTSLELLAKLKGVVIPEAPSRRGTPRA